MPRVHPVAILARFDPHQRPFIWPRRAWCLAKACRCQCFPVQVCAWEAGPLRTTSGFTLSVEHGLEALARAEVVIVPSWRDPPSRRQKRCWMPCGRRMRVARRWWGCVWGAYLLAQAGLLDRRGATTGRMRRILPPSPAGWLNADVLYLADGAADFSRHGGGAGLLLAVVARAPGRGTPTARRADW